MTEIHVSAASECGSDQAEGRSRRLDEKVQEGVPDGAADAEVRVGERA